MENSVKINVSLDLFCKAADQNLDGSFESLSENLPLSPEVCRKAEKIFKDNIEELIEIEKLTECDLLKINQRLYRYHNEQYSQIKDDFYSNLTSEVKVKVRGNL